MHRDKHDEKSPVGVALGHTNSDHSASSQVEQALKAANAELERKGAELRKSEERFRSLFQHAAVGIAIARLDGRFEQVNSRFCEILGYSRDELLQRDFRDITYPDDLKRTNEHVARLLAGEVADFSYEKRYVRKDGRPIWAVATITLLHDEDGQPDRFVGVVEDISERRVTEEIRSRLAAIVDSSDDAIISKTLDGIITTWNQGAERIYGYTAEEMLGKPIVILIPPDRVDEEPAILERVKRGERIDHFETVRRRKDGSLLDISLTISPIRDADGKIVGASKIARDITDRKRREEKLSRQAEELERLVSERTASLQQTVGELESFSYSISHDLRAPLRAIQSFSNILAQEYAQGMDSQAHEYLRRIMAAAERMDRLIRDVLSYSRVSRSEPMLTRVQPEKLLREVLESHESEARHIELKGPFPPVLANETVLTQCVSNLLANAVKFVAPGVTPKVEVTCEPAADGRVRLLFKDNGIGIEPAAQQRIFGIFERLSTRYEGTGIGLAIVKKGIERMGGSVGVTSKPGEGSTFWLELRSA